MIDAVLLGKRIAEALAYDKGPCFYPAKFKPPHKGHYAVVKDLLSRPYIAKIYIIISPKEVGGITAEDSLAVWKLYLETLPTPNVEVKIAESESPIKDIIGYMRKNATVDPIYVVAGDDETDDENYAESLQEQFGDRVKILKMPEKIGMITAPHVRNLLSYGDYKAFVEAVPEPAFNRGAAPKIFKMLAHKTKGEDATEL